MDDNANDAGLTAAEAALMGEPRVSRGGNSPKNNNTGPGPLPSGSASVSPQTSATPPVDSDPDSPDTLET